VPVATKSLTISLEEAIRLRNALAHRGLEVRPPRTQDEVFTVNTGVVEMTVFKNGTLVYKNTIEGEKLLREILLTEPGYDFFVGSDEAGKGEWYGPLVVVAAGAGPELLASLRQIGVRDSKTLSRTAIFEMAQKLTSLHRLRWKEVVLLPPKYNELYNQFRAEGKTLNDLLAWAHSAALRSLLNHLAGKRTKVVIDKFDASKMDLRLKSVDLENVRVVQRTRGEDDPMVATASIIAKWIFENEVDKLSGRLLLNLKKSSPGEVPKERLREIAKLHFQNVSAYLE